MKEIKEVELALGILVITKGPNTGTVGLIINIK